MDVISQMKVKKNKYLKIANQLEKFNNKEVTNELRSELKRFLNSIDSDLLQRVDVGNTITLRISGLPIMLREVVVIESINDKVHVQSDRLWSTISGMNESIGEMQNELQGMLNE